MIIASQSSSSLTLDLQRTIPNLSPRSTSLMISMPLYRIWINRTFINNVYYSDLPLSSFVWKAGIPNSKIVAPPLLHSPLLKILTPLWREGGAQNRRRSPAPLFLVRGFAPGSDLTEMAWYMLLWKWWRLFFENPTYSYENGFIFHSCLLYL